jgi:hypothetical protein
MMGCNMRTRNPLRCAALAAAALALAMPTFAAGGHFAVDDASLLEPGQCGAESWVSRDTGGDRSLRAGAACRVGAFELGAAGEHARGGGSETRWNLEAKWARPLSERFAIGFDVQPARQAHARPHYEGTSVAALATWRARPELAVHANLGRDLLRGAPDQPRAGIAVEWSPGGPWSWTGERYLEEETHFVRAGVRWQAGEAWSIDFSRAQRLAGPAASNWTLGVNVEFARP